MDIPVTLKEGRPGTGRMVWVDTVHIPDEAQAFAVCVVDTGEVQKYGIDELRVCEDAKPMILLHPEKLQEALRKRLGTERVLMPDSNMQFRNVHVQRIPAENRNAFSRKEETDDEEGS